MKVQNEFTPTTKPAGTPGPGRGEDQSRLLKTCQDFESIFLTIIWKEMQKSSGVDLGVYGAFAEGAIGQSWARSGGIGLAKVMFKNMSKHLSD